MILPKKCPSCVSCGIVNFVTQVDFSTLIPGKALSLTLVKLPQALTILTIGEGVLIAENKKTELELNFFDFHLFVDYFHYQHWHCLKIHSNKIIIRVNHVEVKIQP